MNGLLVIDKPGGMTSHDVVARARRLLGEKRIGHAGTLDPMATGVLVLCIGHGTRLSEYLLGEDKAYEGVIALGQRTNTDDAEGQVIATRTVPDITADRLRALETLFTGEIAQVPPQFSAIHKGGVRAYALARKGEAVEMEARPVVVYDLQLRPRPEGQTQHQAPDAAITEAAPQFVLEAYVRCSAGTYIRALARDIGEALGCGGHLSALRRTQAGHFRLADAHTLADVEEASRAGHTRSLLLPMDHALGAWPEVVLDQGQSQRILHGQNVVLPADSISRHTPHTRGKDLDKHSGGSELWRVYDDKRAFIAVAHWRGDDMTLTPVKVFDAAPPLV